MRGGFMHVRYVTRSMGKRKGGSDHAIGTGSSSINPFLWNQIQATPPAARRPPSLFLSTTLCSTLSREFPVLVVSSPTPTLSTPRSFVRSFDQPRCNYIMVLCRDPSPPSDRHLSTPTVPLLPFSPSYVPPFLFPGRRVTVQIGIPAVYQYCTLAYAKRGGWMRRVYVRAEGRVASRQWRWWRQRQRRPTTTMMTTTTTTTTFSLKTCYYSPRFRTRWSRKYARLRPKITLGMVKGCERAGGGGGEARS